MKQQNINWAAAVKPLIEKYKNTPHALEAKNLYEMMAMVKTLQEILRKNSRS